MKIFVTRIAWLFLLFAGLSCQSPEEKFWAWFVAHEDALYNFEDGQEKKSAMLSGQLSEIDENLTYEIGSKNKDGSRKFIISADGIKESFGAVEKLYAKAPSLPKWKFIKFRPRRAVPADIEYNGKVIKSEDVYYKLSFEDGQIGITVFLKGYNDKEIYTYGNAGFLYLDQALGEYDVETKVGAVGFKSTASARFAGAKPITNLAKDFDRFYLSHR